MQTFSWLEIFINTRFNLTGLNVNNYETIFILDIEDGLNTKFLVAIGNSKKFVCIPCPSIIYFKKIKARLSFKFFFN